MTRAFLVVLDSVGIGGAPDAAEFFNDGVPDTGADTLGHIAAACADGSAGRGPLALPNLDAMGLGRAAELASGALPAGLGAEPDGLWGAATEVSRGKDTPSGHWEIAGVPVPFDWTYFPKEIPAIPQDIVDAICKAAGVDGVLGNKHASGTVILDELGPEHMETGKPILYTSADSVVQIAAHEGRFGLRKLYAVCEAIAPMVHEMRVGRVIARPFIGSTDEGFTRTTHRRDYAMEPPALALMDWAHRAGRTVHSVGKIDDIFAQCGVDTRIHGADAELMEAVIGHAASAEDGALVFANFVEFDARFGHRRDVKGYADHLEWFDAQVPRLMAALRPGDLVLFTADHGNDPTWIGTDHTRERVPVVGRVLGEKGKALGQVSFADIGATVAAHLGLAERGAGESLL